MFQRYCFLVLFLSSYHVLAHASLTVGTCRATSNSYATISAAINAAPPGGVIDVCPGIYAEQLTITKPLSIRGIATTTQAGVTIVAPATGLASLNGTESGLFAQVYVSAPGPVNLSNLTVSGAGASVITPFGVVSNLSALCVADYLVDFYGIDYEGTAGTLENLNVSDHYAAKQTGGSINYFFPYCGSGIVLNNRESLEVVVRKSIVSNVAHYGIYSTGNLTAEHNVVTGSLGPRGVGILALGPGSGGGGTPGLGTIRDNTINGGGYAIFSTGIEGGELVRGNIVQSETYGIVLSREAEHNTLINNAIGMSKVDDASDNLITSQSTYPDYTACENPYLPCLVPSKPTVGVDLGCQDASMIRDNAIVGVGIGFANVEAGQRFPASNLFANVGTLSTTCTQ